LRGVAAIFVVIYHMGASESPSYPFASAYLAVDLFFLLSGFALSHAYDPRFAKGMTFSQFMRKRLARLYPSYIVGLLMGIAVFFMMAKMVQTDRFWIAAVTGLLLIPLPIRLSKEPLIFPARWPGLALFMELVAKAAFAVFFLRLRWRGLATIVVASSFILVVLAGTYGNLNLGWDVPNFGADFRPRAFRSCRNIAAPAPAGGIRTLWLDYVGRAGIVALALPIPAADHASMIHSSFCC
jgi:peptidoglycan/LPS O-acetylase OafA/YrhL